jgi:predicted DNA-binding protein
MSSDEERKEKVLHTRVPETLERELKNKASSLGLSVSTLVRNILGNAFELVEDIVIDSANIARTARATGNVQRAGAPASPSDAGQAGGDGPVRVLGWQESVLNLNAVCERCNALLPKGSRAAIAVLEGPGKKPILCLECLTELIHANDPPDREPADV